jgi:phosphoglycolate phosphatase-like HAD superfamily hydrolase
MFHQLFRPQFPRLDEPGTEGGGGGGGAEITPVVDEQRPVSAREKIMEKFEAPDSASEPKEEVPPKKDEAPPAKPDSAASAPLTEDEAIKRWKDTQASYTKNQQVLAEERQKRESLQKQIDMVSKYVDMDKVVEHDKQAELEKGGQPVTHAELAEMERQKSEKEEAARLEADKTVREQADNEYRDAYRKKHPHVLPYLADGSARGVALAIAQADPTLTVEEVGERVATHFRTYEDTIRKRIANELNTRKESLDGAGAPSPRGSMPEEGGGETPADYSASGELAERKARLSRQRTLI